MPKPRRLYSLFEVWTDAHGRKSYVSASDMALPLDRARQVFQNRLLAHALGQTDKPLELRAIDNAPQQWRFIHYA